MLRRSNDALSGRGAALHIVGANPRVRDLLRRDGLIPAVGGIERGTSVEFAGREMEAERT